MNIVKWIFALIATGLVLIAISTSDLFAKDEWVTKPVICNNSHPDVKENFYYPEGLLPLMGGTSQVRINEDENNTEDVVIFIMYNNDDNSAAIMEYHTDYVCALGFMHNVEFDSEVLKGYLDYDR